ncbi:distal membrane-arm assembly complex protein 2 isoform X2 [Trichogramma pretiosum]|uniref:distal membrane-arm assembly complex protein 2 isoform X2 n=1 Tax=Trichogramma pretiosum TaxID=7493 RepID=UPI0006C9BC46|nr:distal membrane-arm assembly complex protein 2 isoform X2 [Trichogramma pretiosum]
MTLAESYNVQKSFILSSVNKSSINILSEKISILGFKPSQTIMIPQKLLRSIKCPKLFFSNYQSNQQLHTSSSQYNINETELFKKSDEKPERRLKEWRKPLIEMTEERALGIGPDNKLIKFFQLDATFTPGGFSDLVKAKNIEREKELQKFEIARHHALGTDLAMAYFLIYRGGKVKFKGHDEWFSLDEKTKSVDIPNKFDANYVAIEFDASDVVLYYEGLENFQNLPRIRRAIFARSPEFDDWFMDRISNLFPNLEYLDVSDCPKLTERGLESLYRISTLKHLIITNNNESAAFELTCMMLEDILPELKIEILKPKVKRESKVENT